MLQDIAIIGGTAVAINILAVEQASPFNSKILSVALGILALVASCYSLYLCPNFYVLGVIISYISKNNLSRYYENNYFHKLIATTMTAALTIITRSGYAAAAAGFFATC